MKARAMMSFSGYGITATNGEVLDIRDEKVFLDLHQAGFVEQIDHVSTEANAKAVEKAEANEQKAEQKQAKATKK